MEDYNIYLLFKQRDKNIIRKIFDGLYIKPMFDELAVYQYKDFTDITQIEPKWIKVSSFEDILKYGMASKKIYASIYYQVENSIFSTIILTFTIDNCLIIGFSVPCDKLTDDSYRSYAKEIMENFNADAVSVFVEAPPPFSQFDFWNQTNKNALFYDNKKINA
jgi:hypothetical protein